MQITRYDETLVDARAVNLTNSIGTVDIDVPVGFSCPTGSFRLSEPNNVTFTHFTADIPSYGGTRAFKITSLTAINSKVTEYYYDIDYLKDYYLRYAGSSGYLDLPNTFVSSELPGPMTNLSNYYPVNTHVTPIAEYITETTGNSMNFSRPYIVIGMARSNDIGRYALQNANGVPITTKAIYMFDSVVHFEDLLVKILSGDRDSSTHDLEPWDDTGTFYSFYSSIAKAYYAPCTFSDTGAVLTQNNIIYYSANNGDLKPKNFADTRLAGEISYITLPTSNGIVTNEMDTGISFQFRSANDLPPYKKYELYVPYIGWYEIPVNEIFPLMDLDGGNIYVKYYYDLINGLISCRFGKGVTSTGGIVNVTYSAYQTPYVPLPEIAIPTSNYATSSIKTDAQYQSQTTSNAISSLMGIGAGLVTGNPALVATSAIHGVTNQMQSAMQRDQAQGLNKLGSFTSGRDSSIGQVDRQFKLKMTEFHQALTYAQAVDLYGMPVNYYTDALYFDTFTPTNKMWLDVTNSRFVGPEWYVSKVRDEFNKDYITYAVTTTP